MVSTAIWRLPDRATPSAVHKFLEPTHWSPNCCGILLLFLNVLYFLKYQKDQPWTEMATGFLFFFNFYIYYFYIFYFIICLWFFVGGPFRVSLFFTISFFLGGEVGELVRGCVSQRDGSNSVYTWPRGNPRPHSRARKEKEKRREREARAVGY